MCITLKFLTTPSKQTPPRRYPSTQCYCIARREDNLKQLSFIQNQNFCDIYLRFNWFCKIGIRVSKKGYLEMYVCLVSGGQVTLTALLYSVPGKRNNLLLICYPFFPMTILVTVTCHYYFQCNKIVTSYNKM